MYQNTYDDIEVPGTTNTMSQGIKEQISRYQGLQSHPSRGVTNINSRASGKSFSNSSGIGSLSSRGSSVERLELGVEGTGGRGVEGGWRRCCSAGCGGCGGVTKGCCWRGVVVVIGLCILGTMAALLTVYLLSCREDYTVSEERSTWGGVDVGWQSVSSCQRLCETSVSTCYGLDYSHDGICWLHRRVYALNQGNTAGVKNYRRQFNCDPGLLCIEKYSTTTNRQAEGGVLIESVSSVPACKIHCETSDRCYGFDHKDEFGKGKCWISTGSYTLSAEPAPGFTNYRRNFNCQRVTFRFTPTRPFFTTKSTK